MCNYYGVNMDRLLDKDYDNIFDGCTQFCQNCPKCIHKTPILPSKSAFGDKNRQNLPNGMYLCRTMMLLSEVSKYHNITYKNQFDRVVFYYVVRQFLREHCDGQPVKDYEKHISREWAQVVLYVYSALPNICKMIEDVVDERALARSLDLGLNRFNQNTYTQVNNILEFLDRKNRMTNLHIRASRAIAELPPKLKETAEIRFFERKSTAEAAEKLQISLRTVQRRTEKLLDEFVPLMKKYGLDDRNLLFEVGKFEPWMLEWFRLSI